MFVSLLAVLLSGGGSSAVVVELGSGITFNSVSDSCLIAIGSVLDELDSVLLDRSTLLDDDSSDSVESSAVCSSDTSVASTSVDDDGPSDEEICVTTTTGSSVVDDDGVDCELLSAGLLSLDVDGAIDELLSSSGLDASLVFNTIEVSVDFSAVGSDAGSVEGSNDDDDDDGEGSEAGSVAEIMSISVCSASNSFSVDEPSALTSVVDDDDGDGSLDGSEMGSVAGIKSNSVCFSVESISELASVVDEEIDLVLFSSVNSVLESTFSVVPLSFSLSVSAAMPFSMLCDRDSCKL